MTSWQLAEGQKIIISCRRKCETPHENLEKYFQSAFAVRAHLPSRAHIFVRLLGVTPGSVVCVGELSGKGECGRNQEPAAL